MKKLPKTFSAGGFDYKQVWRKGKWAVYERCKGDRAVAWELIKVRVRQEEYVPQMKVLLPKREMYPAAREFGVWGWSLNSLADAEVKQVELTKKVDKMAPSDVVPVPTEVSI